MSFEQIGIEFIAKGADSAAKQIDGYNKSLLAADSIASKTAKTQGDLAKASSSASKSLSDAGKGAKGGAKGVDMLKTAFGDLTDGLTDVLDIGGDLDFLFEGMLKGVNKLSGGLGVATAGVAAFLALGVRGAGMRGIEEGFQETFAGIGIDADDLLARLKTAANGMVNEMDLMTKANMALVGATGVVAEEFGNKLPELMAVAAAAARKTGQDVDFLFESLVLGVKRGSPQIIDNTGITLDSTAAMEAYAESIGKTADQLTAQEQQIATLNAVLEAGAGLVADNANAQETASDKMARLNAVITDMLDNLAINVQPLFEMLLDLTLTVVNAFAGLVRPIANAIGVVLRLIQMAVDEIKARWAFIPAALRTATDNALMLMQIFGIQLIQGAANTWAAFVNTINRAKAAIVNAVAGIAEAIAAFLIGQSPPPEGALSDIDRGGARTFQAWLDGVSSVSLDPIADVTAEVDAMMGSIGSMSLPMVEGRLAQLDRALKPFSDRLEIVKAQMEAINEPAQAAIRAIERQQNQIAQAFADGNAQAADMMRALDAQREAIEQRVDAQQRELDIAQVQFTLAKAGQAVERSKLEIRKRELKALEGVEKREKAITKARAQSTREAKAPTGGAVAPAGAVDTVGNLPAMESQGGRVEQNTRGFLAGANNMFAAAGGIWEGAFDEALNTDLIDDYENGLSRLSDAQAGIAEGGGLGGVFGTAFGNLGDTIQENLVDPLQEKIEQFTGYFTDETQEGSLAAFFANIRDNGIGEALGMSEAFSGLSEWFSQNLAQPIRLVLTGLLDPLFPNSIPARFENVITNIQTAIGDLTTFFTDDIFGGVRDWIFGDSDDGGLPALISRIGQFFGEIPVLIGSALQGIGLLAWNGLVSPIVSSMNFVIERVNDFLNATIGNAAIRDINQRFNLGLPTEFQLDLIEIQPPAALTTPLEIPTNPNSGAARGGLFGGGAINVGESGREVMASAEPFAVFSNRFVEAIDMFADTVNTMTMSVSRMSGGMSVSNNNSINITNNNASMSATDATRIAMLRTQRG